MKSQEYLHIKFNKQEIADINSKIGKGGIRERSLFEMLELLNEWRDLKATQGFSLESASIELGVARKSLDDYMRIVNHAKKMNFNFVKHINDHFNLVRLVVKNCTKGTSRI